MYEEAGDPCRGDVDHLASREQRTVQSQTRVECSSAAAQDRSVWFDVIASKTKCRL